ncbi:MAG: Ribosome-binding ATPase YchF [Candidatus Tokpelaia sp. JSC161]|jgi:hypothetical protein|nr:MAG: Ribosome-binding ATPase YchF [Candidatus Tokpelaia sp. JSC161]
MGFKCGIIGLPNVGKSTLFNALTKTAAAQAANYPFCTIEPNTGEVSVPDHRIEKIAAIAKSQKIIPTRIQFVDIAGLVQGASKGEGLGNQFLSNIRDVDAIIHVVRCFVKEDIPHISSHIDPVSDAKTVETELMLSDLDNLEKRLIKMSKRIKSHKDKDTLSVPIIQKALNLLQNGTPARLLLATISYEEGIILKNLNLLTSKPVLYVCNVAENNAKFGNKHTQSVINMASQEKSEVIMISAAIEAEISQLPDYEAKEYLATIGLNEPSLHRLIRAGYHLLNLITYFTSGPKETRAWTIKAGTKAHQAAGKIHTDLEKGFIRAQTISYQDYVSFSGELAAKEAGKTREEGKEYIVQDGDIIFFKHNP